MNEPHHRVLRRDAEGGTVPQGLMSTGLLLAADHWQLSPHQCGPVVYAATPSGKDFLLEQLLAALPGQGPPGLKPGQGLPLQLTHGSLGQPILLLDGASILSVSFSLGGGLLWGALAGTGRVGLDAAFAPDFPPDYPLQRVFSQEEFGWTCALLGGDASRAAALLWSLKEAAVKALGVGFNYLAPREITTGPGKPWRGGYLFEVNAGCLVKTWVRPAGDGWVALALKA
jgi:hypothetical protein